jgi:hypothetical protein
MALEVDFLLRMDFLSRAEFALERLHGGDESDAQGQGRLLHICNGPYNHVTSLSLDLLSVRSKVDKKPIRKDSGATNQLMFSEETVRRRNFNLAHDLHDAFSNLILSPNSFLATTYRQEVQISSSFHLYDR